MFIISVDPGLVTGMDLYTAGHRETLEVPHAEVGSALRRWNAALSGVHERIDMAVERYTMTPGIKSPQPHALMIMGVCEDHARHNSWTLSYYTPGMSKKLCTNDTLRRLGWWTPTKDGHANDARRITLAHISVKFPEEFGRLTGI